MTGKNPGRATDRHVVANISLSLDGRTTGPGGEYDTGWVAPHAVIDRSRDHLRKLTAGATTVLLGRKNYQGFSSYRPAVADDEEADPRDREFSRWLNGRSVAWKQSQKRTRKSAPPAWNISGARRCQRYWYQMWFSGPMGFSPPV